MQIDFSTEGMDELFHQIDNLNFSRKEKADIVEAGAQVAEQRFRKAARDVANSDLDKIVMDFKATKGGRYELPGHLYNGITHQYNQDIDGGTNVGFMKGYVTVAHWVDGGTYRQPAQFFFTRAAMAAETDEGIRKAEALVAADIFERKTRGM